MGEQVKTIKYRFHAAKSAECEQSEPKTCVGDAMRHTNGQGNSNPISATKKKTHPRGVFFFLFAKGLVTLRPLGYEHGERSSLGDERKTVDNCFLRRKSTKQEVGRAKTCAGDRRRLCDWTGLCSH